MRGRKGSDPSELLALETYLKQQQTTATGPEWLDLALYYLLTHAGLRISKIHSL